MRRAESRAVTAPASHDLTQRETPATSPGGRPDMERASEKIGNWGFQENSLLKAQALVTNIEDVYNTGEI
jgi:hypothetical protein